MGVYTNNRFIYPGRCKDACPVTNRIRHPGWYMFVYCSHGNDHTMLHKNKYSDKFKDMKNDRTCS